MPPRLVTHFSHMPSFSVAHHPVVALTFPQYGFPSTHSANSISMALYFAELIFRHNPSLTALDLLAYAFLSVMAFSVVFGRLYCGMHSLTDVTVGSMMGVVIWAAHWVAEGAIERLTLGGNWVGEWLPSSCAPRGSYWLRHC